MSAPIRIVMADDHALLRQGLRVLLEGSADLVVVGETADGAGAIDLVRDLRPDILLLDLRLEGLDGLDVLLRVAGRTRVVIVSAECEDEVVIEALRRGARGFVPKQATLDELERAVREVAGGGRYVSRLLPEARILAALACPLAVPPDPFDSLTAREHEVLELAAQGLKNPEIGRRLFISPRTVESHCKSIKSKLGLKTAADLVRYGAKRGLV